MNIFNQHKVKWFWSIWAFGLHRIKDFRGDWIEMQIFFGPIVVTFWR